MEKAVGNQAGKVSKKGKKKQAKDELDRQKQAEKKRRRLEKALANSAAIISELEKKKQKKREEQERLDEEGASIAEAVALHVLIGEEDSDESRHLILNKHRRCNDWDPSAGFDFTLGTQGDDIIYPSACFDFTLDTQDTEEMYLPGRLVCANHAHATKGRWTDWGNAHPLQGWGEVRDLKVSYHQGTFHNSVACPGFMAAQAVSSLQIREDSSGMTSASQGVAAATVVNRMLGGTNRLSLYREI